MTEAIRPPSLNELLETYQAWSLRDTFGRIAERADADGDATRAAELREIGRSEASISAVDALAAQHEVSSLLSGWEWLTIRAAREDGASWGEVAASTRTDPEQARAGFLARIEQAEQYGHNFTDGDRYRRAAGNWTDELHADTPERVRQQVADASARGDVDELDALRAAWWDPDHSPAPPRAEQPGHVMAYGPDRLDEARSATDAVPAEVTLLAAEPDATERAYWPTEQSLADDDGTEWSR